MRSSKKTLIILGLLSFISLIAFMSLLLGSDENYSYRKYLLAYIYAPIACVYLLLAILTYIIKKIKENRKRSLELKKYINPSFAILTFILFNIFPTSLVILHDFVFPNAKWLYTLVIIIAELVWMTDPLIYIFTLKLFRRKIQRKLVTFKSDTATKERIITRSK